MPEICLVVPCFNEAQRLRGGELLAFLDAHASIDVCLVDDGSTDGTYALIEQLQRERPDRIVLHRLQPNGGKADAVRHGVLHAASTGRWPVVGYWDADFSTPLVEAERLAEVLREAPGCQMVLGSRIKRLGARIDRNVARHVFGRVFASAASAVLGLEVYDSQCGAKLLRAELAPRLFADPFLTRWLFDLEMLLRLRNQVGLTAMDIVQEVPLAEWREVGGSKLTLRDMINVPLELLRLRAHYNRPRR
jgi:glycosyltransferase involved in cell wall biosynthesis